MLCGRVVYAKTDILFLDQMNSGSITIAPKCVCRLPGPAGELTALHPALAELRGNKMGWEGMRRDGEWRGRGKGWKKKRR